MFKQNRLADLNRDLQMIKSLFAKTSTDARQTAGDFLSDSFDNMKHKSCVFQDKLGDKVADKPIKFLGLAILSGLLCGYWLHSGKRRR